MATKTTKKTPAKKTTAKSTAKKTTARKTVAKKAPAKKAVARKAPIKKVTPKKTVAKKAPAKKEVAIQKTNRTNEVIRVVIAILINSLFSATLVNGSVNPLEGLKYFESYNQSEELYKIMLIFIPVYLFQIIVWHYLTILKWTFWERAMVVVVSCIGAFVAVHNILPVIFS